VLVACDSKQKQVLSKEFPAIRYAHLGGYNIHYGKSRAQTLLQICFQIPKILTAINREKAWLQNFLRVNRVTAIFSDNRYGFFSDKTPGIFMTHQLQVISGFGQIIDRFIQRLTYFYINKFTVCWVPDWANKEVNAAGKLSHPLKKPKSSVQYIGCISRLEKCFSNSCTTDLLIILSGPEPQRSIFESIILDQLKSYTGTAVLVRGVFDNISIESFARVNVINNASAAELNSFICNSEIVLGRSGYTGIMDILKLRKKSILVPTPGQAEQEYLASYLHKKRLAYSTDQEKFSLNTAVENCRSFVTEYIPESMDQYKDVVNDFVSSLKGHMVNDPAQI
jgi:hypothetical protein